MSSLFSHCFQPKGSSLFTLLLALFSFSCKPAKKQHLPTAKEVIERYIEASGGGAKIRSIRSFREEGSIGIPGVGYAETILLYEPGKPCLIYKYPSGYVSKTVYNNGKAADVVNGETTIITDTMRLEQLELYKNLFADINYLENGYKLLFVNTENINSRLHYRIKITSPKGAIDYKLYDAETGLLTLLADADGNKTTFNDYENHEGLIFPMNQSTIKKDGGTFNVQVSKIILNKRIDSKLFDFK